MVSIRLCLCSLLLPLFCMPSMSSALALLPAQGDREEVRQRVEQPVRNPVEVRQLFEHLKSYVQDEAASPDDRCSDFYRAVRLLLQFDRPQAVVFAEEVSKQTWPSKASPAKRGMYTCGMAVAYLANRQNAQAVAKLKEITPEERNANPTVEAIRADLFLIDAQTQGDYVRANEWANTLVKAVDNPAVSTRIRTEYLVDALRFFFDEGAPTPVLQKVIDRCEAIFPSATGEAADRMYVLLQIVKSEIEYELPWPSAAKAQEERKADLFEFVDRLRKKLPDLKSNYGPMAPATIMAMQAVASMDLQLAPLDKSPKPHQLEAFELCDEMLRDAAPVMIENERIWLLRGVAAGMLDRYSEVQKSYAEVTRIQAAANVDVGAGLRFSRRLMLLGICGNHDPAFVAKEWSSAIAAFAGHVRSLAMRDPDLALSSLEAWNPIPMYGGIASHGRPAVFLDGFVQATGIIKNVPFGRKESAESRGRRLYGSIGLADVQKQLTPDRPMVVYVRFEDQLPPKRSYIGGFFLDGKQVRYVDLGSTQTIDAAVGAWKKSMLAPIDGGSGDPKATGAKLYNLLVRPLIQGKLPPGLFVVPDRGLEQISFAAFRTPSSKWVVEDCAVRYLGAMRDIAADDRIVTQQPSMLLEGDIYRDHTRLGLATLSLGAMRKVDPKVTAREATPGRLFDLRSPAYLHLSVHGDNRPASEPLQLADASWLLLPGDSKAAKDIPFTARQVSKLHLEATHCVLLAACAAAKSKVLAGDGMGGLRRAFYIAGARSVISSLLTVPETRSSLASRRGNGNGYAPGDELLSKVYPALAKGAKPAEALREAQLQTLRNRETASPLYWAGFTCEGG